MPDYKLIYFNAQGRAELTRWCFAYGGIPYVDERVENEDWPARKKEMPAGQMPVLLVDGKPLTESIAIARYVAKQAGLVPVDDLQAAYCDAVVDRLLGVMDDVWHKVVFCKEEPAEKQRILNELVSNKINPVLTWLEQRIKPCRMWYIADKVTWADIQIALVCSSVQERVPDLLKDFCCVKRLVDDILKLKPIKNHLIARPKNAF